MGGDEGGQVAEGEAGCGVSGVEEAGAVEKVRVGVARGGAGEAGGRGGKTGESEHEKGRERGWTDRA